MNPSADVKLSWRPSRDQNFDDSSTKNFVIKGNLDKLPRKVKTFVTHCVHLFAPRAVYICDGSQEEANFLTEKLVRLGTLTRLTKYKNSFLCRTDPRDVARVEGRTFICTEDRQDAVPCGAQGHKGILGNWMSPEEAKAKADQRFPNCMKGRVMFVLVFCMAPLDSPLCKIGVQVTDSPYVVLSMRIMTRISPEVVKALGDGNFVKCIHSVGRPCPVKGQIISQWPCNPKKLLVLHYPKERIIKSFGSGYGGNSLLGKKCFALRLATVMARDEGWMAEHMMIMSITTPQNREFFVVAAFPSACGKTNLAMLKSSLPGYKVKCVGDDIAWMRFDDDGVLRAINPETGFFGVAPGTNARTNPHAMRTIQDNTIFTNVAETADGDFFWQGLEDNLTKKVGVTDWRGEAWQAGDPNSPAHPNARFTVPARQCPVMHPRWADPRGVPVTAIIFGGRRPHGVPLVYQAKSWAHGVMTGACIKSECTAAAEHTGSRIMHDPMAMRPFLGYNFGKYLQHWLDMEQPGRKMPEIFHVNWFRRDDQGGFLWPGFGDNIRVLDWILRRCDGDNTICLDSPVGFLPKKGCINLTGLGAIDEDAMYSLPTQWWLDDTRENIRFLENQFGPDTPDVIKSLLSDQEKAFQQLVKRDCSHAPCAKPANDRCHVTLCRPFKAKTAC